MKRLPIPIPAGKEHDEWFKINYESSKFALTDKDEVEFQTMVNAFFKERGHLDWNEDDIAFVYEVNDNGFKEMAIHISGIVSPDDDQAKKKLAMTNYGS